MARLSEHEGKVVLARHGMSIPRGRPAGSASEAREAARAIGAPVVVKAQAWTTGRAAMGGVAFASNPDEAADHAARMLAMSVGQFPVTQVLVEERLEIVRELFVSLAIDDRRREAMILFSPLGGSGVEERAASTARIPCDPVEGVDRAAVERAVGASRGQADAAVVDAVMMIAAAARAIEARSLEVNPLVLTRDGRVMAADCRITVDDYAVVRHPELGIEIAREFDHPATSLERIAYAAEMADHRGTFYFAQLATRAPEGSKGLVGFHGSGGGGSMMAMDALVAEGFTPANFTDTSGNPSSAKVYRAARCILSQQGIVGYFGSGSGVASQEQFWSAYGLAKAFCELELSIPAVIRLGGNTEDRAVEVLRSCCGGLGAPVEGYRKSDTPAFIAKRFAELVEQSGGAAWTPRPVRIPEFVTRAKASGERSLPLRSGRVWIDSAAWNDSKALVLSNASGLLRDDGGRPVLAATEEEFAGKDSEMIACEMECRRAGRVVIFVELDMPTVAEAPGTRSPALAEARR